MTILNKFYDISYDIHIDYNNDNILLKDIINMNHHNRGNYLKNKYPNIKKYFNKTSIYLKYQILFIVFTLNYLSYFSEFINNIYIYFIFSYLIGGIFTNILTLGMHELSHNHAFKSYNNNRLFTIICDLGFGIPVAESFRKYHMIHHKYNGIYGLDPDIPTYLEQNIFQNKFGKFIWIIFQGFFYSIRPFFIKLFPLNKFQLFSYFCSFIRFTLLWYFIGFKSAIYPIIALLFGAGLHPLAGHFLTEHFYKDNNFTETNSYYGWMNYITFNVGYHNEHHDFPQVPGYLLPNIKNDIYEYNFTPSINSWFFIIFDFIFNPKYKISNRKMLKNN